MALGPIMLDVDGPRLSAEDREVLAHPLVGGVVLFDRNYLDPTQLEALVGEIHAVRAPRLLVAVDHEGGRVQRFRHHFTRLPAPAAFGDLYDADPHKARRLARDYGWLMAAELRAVGIDFSFAPVLDLGARRSTVIGNRALHRDPEVVATLAQAVMGGMARAGMCAVGKHFPGHGSVEADSHHALPVDHRDMDEIREADMLVFERLIHYGIPALMAGHVCYTRVDGQPAGYSRFWLQQILREELGFGGALFSDDLGMAAAAVAGSMAERARAALEAGCDMALVCNDRQAALAVLEELEPTGSALRAVHLARMHGRGQAPWRQLRASTRYGEISRTIAALDPAPELDLGDDSPA
jgi:beta-N-acetylhexosaminidase